MKRVIWITVICAVSMLLIVYGAVGLRRQLNQEKEHITIGFLYVGDSCDTYTHSFVRAQKSIEQELAGAVTSVVKYNVAEGEEEESLQELVDAGCDLIFSTSYGYGETTKKFAERYPQIEFCMATGDNANVAPVLGNFHNFMGEIYQGRYIAGVVAGMKLQELIEEGVLTADQAKIGYVGAFPYAEVISGYTAFFLGVCSVVPETQMDVIYTNSWGDYDLEKKVTIQLIERGCVIISQHSDTTGPAIACEEQSGLHTVYHVGYNQSMADVAPTTSLISCRINWEPYMVAASKAVLKGRPIEAAVKGSVLGNDISGGFHENWVQMLKLNKTVAAEGTQQVIDRLIQDFENDRVHVYQGNYTGTNPFDANDTIDLIQEYKENKKGSAPSFHYVLDGVIHIIEE